MRMCEGMARILSWEWPCCDLYALENIHHIVMQCPDNYSIRSQMYKDIYYLNDDVLQKISSKTFRKRDGIC